VDRTDSRTYLVGREGGTGGEEAGERDIGVRVSVKSVEGRGGKGGGDSYCESKQARGISFNVQS
jgi:hypothetical protein